MDTNIAAASLPVLDLGLFEQGPVGRERFLADLRRAARDVGFFSVVNHGVPRGLNDDVASGWIDASRAPTPSW